MSKFVIMSDLHFHAWSQFSKVMSNGVNSRLQIMIDEFHNACEEGRMRGANDVIIAGDIFHSRGSLDPEILNPVRDAVEAEMDKGMSFHAICGNHDLKSNDTRAISSSIQNLEGVSMSGASFNIYNQPTQINISGAKFGFIPWINDADGVKKELHRMSKLHDAEEIHVFIHAGVDGVLANVPSGKLNPKLLQSYGFKSVFAGHYHNHKDLTIGTGGRVMSIGASTQHNWGDIGTRAGFLIFDADKDEIEFNDSGAPKYKDVSGLDELDMELECVGNYARFRGPQMTQAEINELREQMIDWGAIGVSIEVPRAVVASPGVKKVTGMTLDESVQTYIDSMEGIPESVDVAEIKRRSQALLDSTRMIEA